MDRYDPQVVLEFYANVFPKNNERGRTRTSWVRGHKIDYSRDAIEEVLRTGYETVEGHRNTFYSRLYKNEPAYEDQTTTALLCLPGRSFEANIAGVISQISLNWEFNI